MKRLAVFAFALGMAVAHGANRSIDLGVQGHAPRTPSITSLIVRFVKAENQASYHPSTSDLAVAVSALGSAKTSLVGRAASAFCLALANVQREQNVRKMVGFAMKAWPADTEWSDGHSALPEALLAVFVRSKSEAAANALASLNFDGAPGELLADVQGEAFTVNSRLLAHVWVKVPAKSRHLLPEGLAFEAGDDADLKAVLRRGTHSKDPAIKKLSLAALNVK